MSRTYIDALQAILPDTDEAHLWDLSGSLEQAERDLSSAIAAAIDGMELP